MTMSHAAAPRMRLGAVVALLTLLVGLAAAMLTFTSRANAADYPPPGPTGVSTCTTSNSCEGAGGDVVQHNPQGGNTGGLANTGFNTATALVIVALLVGTGVVCIRAGLVRRRT
jgi:hypothetical protein